MQFAEPWPVVQTETETHVVSGLQYVLLMHWQTVQGDHVCMQCNEQDTK